MPEKKIVHFTVGTNGLYYAYLRKDNSNQCIWDDQERTKEDFESTFKDYTQFEFGDDD